MSNDQSNTLVSGGAVNRKILLIRGLRAIIDVDLAEIYAVTTKRFNEQVKRNRNRFPPDFMFQLTKKEKAEVVAKCDHLSKLKFSPHLPYVFTEHGAIMAASVLNSTKAVEMSVYVVRAFVRMREFLAVNEEFSQKLARLETMVADHDQTLSGLIQAIQDLMTTSQHQPKPIGFTADLSIQNEPLDS